MRSFLFLLALFTAATLGHSALAAIDIQNIKNLPGYNETNLVSGFTEFLQNNPDAFKKLENNSQLSHQIFRTPSLQRAMMQTTVATQNSAADTTQNNNRLNNNTNATISDDAQDLIKRALANHEKAQDDPEFAAALASGAYEGEDNRAANTDEDISIANVNAIPSADSAALDENGWPKYLQAPAHCKPPVAGLTYIHEFRHSVTGGTTGLPSAEGKLAASKNNLIGSYFYNTAAGSATSTSIYLKYNDVIAAPFIMPSESSFGVGEHEYSHGTETGQLVSISDCPGDIGNAFTGNTFGGKKCAGSAPYSVVSSRHCGLERGKRYFFNLQPATEVQHVIENTAENQRRNEQMQQFCHTGNAAVPQMCTDGSLIPTQVACYHQPGAGVLCQQGNGQITNAHPDFTPAIPTPCVDKECKAMTLVTTVAQTAFLKPVPYNGPCLKQGPYPVNYNNTTCGRSFGSQRCTITGDIAMTCTDPQDELAAVRLVKSCKTGQLPIWLEGYGEPIHSRMVCKVEKPAGEDKQIAQTDSRGRIFYVPAPVETLDDNGIIARVFNTLGDRVFHFMTGFFEPPTP